MRRIQPLIASEVKFEEYLVEYPYEGETWVMHVKASSFEDAAQRVQHAARYGTVLGSVKFAFGWMGIAFIIACFLAGMIFAAMR